MPDGPYAEFPGDVFRPLDLDATIDHEFLDYTDEPKDPAPLVEMLGTCVPAWRHFFNALAHAPTDTTIRTAASTARRIAASA